ncbi:hypothetical protein BDA99DRAFT_444819 [Phascolomyces articulosus]|uniref:Uncharacterized protein n=1 Tax=Phascolomyces articulosus TaxID=60185 RepID=A0AAD5PB88_9FUNG|nr:hypothetical protein BDA99DRAFT_444819 [Phascolomyces articulosus]
MPLDLASLNSVKNFVEIFLTKYDQPHMLINNAGLISVGPFERVEDGFEAMFGVNVIGTHYLTILLLPILENSRPSRIVNVVLMLLSFELDRRLRSTGIFNLYINTSHPGSVKNGPYYERVRKNSPFDRFIGGLFLATADVGALPQLYLTTSPEVEEKNIHSKYYVPNAKPGWTSAYTKSEKEAEKAWNIVERFIKEKVPYYPGASIYI